MTDGCTGSNRFPFFYFHNQAFWRARLPYLLALPVTRAIPGYFFLILLFHRFSFTTVLGARVLTIHHSRPPSRISFQCLYRRQCFFFRRSERHQKRPLTTTFPITSSRPGEETNAVFPKSSDCSRS